MTSRPFTLSLLADQPRLVEEVADMRWREWGHAPEPEDPAWWLETTTREAGRDQLPATFVAVDRAGAAIGAVGLAEYDLAERRDRSPWVIGMIVRTDHRGAGIGRALLNRLEAWAAQRGTGGLWVATGEAAGFYRRCGWLPAETLATASGQPCTVLGKRLSPTVPPV